MELKDDKDYKEFMVKLSSSDKFGVEFEFAEIAEMYNKQLCELTIERNNQINDMLEKMVDGGQVGKYGFAPAPTNECEECYNRDIRFGYSRETLLGYMRMAFDFGVANRL